MGLVMSVGSLYKLETKSQIYHRMAMNQKYSTANMERNVIL